MSNWKSGDRALAIGYEGNDKSTAGLSPNGEPKNGTIYLVNSITDYWNGKHIGLTINQFPAICPKTGIEIGWNQRCFRKIVPACDRISQQEEGLIPHEGFFEGRPDL
jgi:hypothetical protein